MSGLRPREADEVTVPAAIGLADAAGAVARKTGSGEEEDVGPADMVSVEETRPSAHAHSSRSVERWGRSRRAQVDRTRTGERENEWTNASQQGSKWGRTGGASKKGAYEASRVDGSVRGRAGYGARWRPPQSRLAFKLRRQHGRMGTHAAHDRARVWGCVSGRKAARLPAPSHVFASPAMPAALARARALRRRVPSTRSLHGGVPMLVRRLRLRALGRAQSKVMCDGLSRDAGTSQVDVRRRQPPTMSASGSDRDFTGIRD